MTKIAIIGGGISGLSLAHALSYRSEASFDPMTVHVFEKKERWGGNIVTEYFDGCTLDAGPDSWVARKSSVLELIRSIGLEDELIEVEPSARRVYRVGDSPRLQPMPEGFMLGIPASWSALWQTPLFSWKGKLRIACEPFVPSKSWERQGDESIGDFFMRRFGEEMTYRMAAPLLGGIFAGDIFKISLRATFPQLIEAEMHAGSLVKAIRAERKRLRSHPLSKGHGPFLSLKRGMGSLVERLVSSLEKGGVHFHLSAPIERIERCASSSGPPFRVYRAGDSPFLADRVVLAIPTHAAASLLREIYPECAQELDTIPYTSVATVFLAYPKDRIAHPLDAAGVLIPRESGRKVLAATWISSKWAHRAPPSTALLRIFFGGSGREEIVSAEDRVLVQLAREEVKYQLSIDGEPSWVRVFRFLKTSLQPPLAHLKHMEILKKEIESEGPIHLLGGSVVSMPDCISQAFELAYRLTAQLSRSIS
ncbi:protoporphyrinogen oxidase [Pajaroellobacter abortibovis]|uniref:Protoporphyrinogen oxidase n=1 Tax=Pajaroellobacter abortibovis TaxID=1882918 RepID=A0A1L6MXQ2_9BACT|nr:protoporphyrinogen oxidase [Pajaroellobacter abortibovis]APS00256.1 protoporphyrinogen oxidase [Pajaroellobacter abortibovis]